MIVRSSLLSCAHRCVAESYYRYHLGLVPHGKRANKDLFFGTAVHRGIEIGLLQSENDALAYLDSLLWPPAKVKTKDCAKILVRKFLSTFKDTVLYTEKLSEFSFGSHTWRLRYDIISENDGVIVNENKTTNPSYLITKPNSQFISYYISGQREFPSFNRFKVYNLDPAFMEIHILPVYFSKAEITEWLVATERFVDYLEGCFTKKILPMNGSACIRFYTHLCPYYDICSSSTEIRDQIITNLYEVELKVKELSY